MVGKGKVYQGTMKLLQIIMFKEANLINLKR